MTPETPQTESDPGKFVALAGGDATSRRPPTAAEQQGPAETANLVTLLTADERKQMGVICLRDFEADVDSRSERMRKIRQIIEIASLDPKPKSRPFQNAANVMAPMMTSAILQIGSRLYDMVWPLNGQVVHSISTTVADLEVANYTERFANSYLRYRMPEMAQGMDDTCHQIVQFGSAFRRTYWDQQAGRVRSDWIPITDFVVGFSVRSQDPSMSDVERYTMIQHLTIYDLEDLKDAGVFDYDPAKVKADDSSEESRADNEATEAIQKSDGQEPDERTSPEDKPRKVLEMHRRWRLPKRPGKHPAFDGKAHPVMVTIDEKSQEVMRVVLREEDDPDDAKRFQRDMQAANEMNAQFDSVLMAAQQMGQAIDEKTIEKERPKPPKPIRRREICFFTHYRCFASEGFYGKGYGDLLLGLNKATNTIINQSIDASTLRNAPPGFISRQAKMQRGDVNTQPGMLTELDMPPAQMKDAVHWAMPPGTDPAVVPMLNMIQQMSDRIAGSSDTMSGQIPGSNQTAEGMKLLVEQMNLPVTVLSRRVSAAFSHELEKIWRCWGTFLPDWEITDIVNEANQPQQIPIGRAMFSPTARVVPASDPRLKSQRVNEANAITEAAKHPFIMGSPANPPHPNAAQIMEAVVSQQFSTLGADRLVPMLKLPPPPPPPPPPQPDPPYVEHAAWLRGQDHPVHPMDDDQSHIAEHQMFLQGPEGAALPPQGQEMAMNHVRHHMAAIIEKQNGGGPQMMPPGGPPNGQPAGPPPGPGGPPGPGPMGPPPGHGPGPMAGGAPNGPVPPPPGG